MAEITRMWIADKMRELMKHKPIVTTLLQQKQLCR